MLMILLTALAGMKGSQIFVKENARLGAIRYAREQFE
jgi:hypothetical protein